MTFLCEPEEIITQLRLQLAQQGKDLLRGIKKTEYSIQFACPWHKNGQERKPSCGLITHKKPNGMPVGMVHCLACGKTSSFEEMISNCFGIYDGGVYGFKWLVDNFQHMDINTRDAYLSTLSSNISRDVKSTRPQYVTDEELDSYRYYHPYMYQRKLNDDVINRFDIGFDKNFTIGGSHGALTFPVRDIHGRTLFVAKRAVDTKVFHYPASAVKPLYGLYELNQLHKFPTEIFVCESMLDALPIWTHPGCYAIALNGLGSSTQLKELNNLPCRKLILATDNDEAGLNARYKIKQQVPNKIVSQVIIPNGKKDINDLSYDEFENLRECLM